MATKNRPTFDNLKEEIVELKLTDIRKDINALKEALVSELIDVKKEVTETKEHVKTTNGSVAKVTEQAFKLELQYEGHQAEDKRHWEKLDKMDQDTQTLRWLSKRPKLVLILIGALMYSMAVPEIRQLLGELLKKIF